jgi:GNAT superfamily N-acetyltransferase
VTDHYLAHRLAMGRALSNLANGTDFDGGVDEKSWRIITGIASPDWNMALVFGDDDAALDDLVARIAAKQAPCLVMFAADGISQAARLPGEYAEVGSMPVMQTRAPFANAQADPRARITGIGDAEAVLTSLCKAYGMDPEVSRPALLAAYVPEGDFEVWALEVDGEVVSSVWVFLDGDVVSVWAMATPPEHQRKGYGRALLGAVLANAQEAEATVGLLGATPDGFPLYAATGWETFEDWTIYTNAASAQFSH